MNKNLKIALVSEWREPLVGWGQVYAKYQCEYLVKEYHCRVDVFTRAFIDEQWVVQNKNESYEHGNRNVRRIGPAGSFFSSIYRILGLITTTRVLFFKAKKIKYDIIHAQALLAGIPARIVGRLLGIPVVYTVHWTMHMDAKKKGLLYYAEKFLVTGIPYDLEISVSHNVLRYPSRNKNIAVIYPWIDFERFENAPTPAKYEWCNFLFVGRFDWQKGLEYLIKAIGKIDVKLLREKKFHLNLVGDWALKESIQKLVASCDRQEFVSFKGKLLFGDLVAEYKKNQVFILPSLAEGQPVVVFEAFINKLPVVATNVGDNAYIIKNGENGFLLEPGSITEIAQCIKNVLELKHEQLEKLGDAWYKLTKHGFSRTTIVKQIYDEYQKLLHK